MSQLPVTDADGKVPFMVGFATDMDAQFWSVNQPRFSIGHETFLLHSAEFNYADLLCSVTLKLDNYKGVNVVHQARQRLRVVKLVVNWGPPFEKELRQTTITEDNVNSTLFLMIRRGVDIIGAICVSTGGCELSLSRVMRFSG